MRFARHLGVASAAALTLTALLAAPVKAAEPKGIGLELNKVATVNGGCLLTFVANNATGAALAAAGFEFVLFSKDGVVDRMTVFDFGALPEGKTVVRQFQIAGAPCEGFGSILVNGPSGCGAAAAAPLCSAPLTASSRTAVSFGR
ncbi:hypothetical protein [Pannonibacter tanglangensis]|uniref:Tat pathway signal sequence domain protein n=1 Tax=Pannonibacter tanglangensis TaxID=2750084 RepID=A0ABW9ZCC8_9HYPH|nr:hypothetical protein [Pannonibacter sp. XCT-34]NBN62161.1 hypothetical protein [Pannonibacter sp. XCT-34]